MGSTEPISLNHYGRSCDVTRFMWCVFLGYFFIPQDWMFMWAALRALLHVCMYYNHGRSTSRVAITVQSQGQVKTDMQGQVTVITHMIQRSLTCRYPIYIENTTTYNIYNVRRSAVHTYWNWVSMLMLMLLERIIYFVFVFRMLLPFYFFFIHGSESWGTMRSWYIASVATFAEGSLFVLSAP